MKKFRMFPKQFGFFPYIFMVYFAMPIYYATLESGWKAVLGYTLVLLFLISYRQMYWFPPVKIYSLWLALQLAIIIILSIWYEPYNLFLGFFPANFIGWYDRKWHFHRALIAFSIVLLGLMVVLAIQYSLIATLYMVPFVLVMLISPFGIRSMNKRMELERQLDQANEQIKELVKREERVRIARDLHDTLGHTLSLITLQSQLVQRLAEKDPLRAKEEAKEIERMSRSALRQVRELVSDMRANTIAEELLHLEQILTAAEIEFRREGIDDFSNIPPLQQNILAMCLREAGTNVVKHSRAKHCAVTIKQEKGYLEIAVQDDGRGLKTGSGFGNGLNGIRERLSLIDGTFEIQSNPGTTIVFKVPVIMKQEEIAL